MNYILKVSSKDGLSYSNFILKEIEYLDNSPRFLRDIDLIINEYFGDMPPSNPLFMMNSFENINNLQGQFNIAELELDLNSVTKKLKITPFIYYFSCYLLTLELYSNTNDLVVAIPVTTRTYEYENSIGPFINTTLFRKKTQNPQTYSFVEFCKQLKSEWAVFQDTCALIPLNKVFSNLRDKHQTNFENCFTNMFNYSLQADDDYMYVPALHPKTPLCVDVICHGMEGKTKLIITWANECLDAQIAKNFFKTFMNACKMFNINDIINQPLSEVEFVSYEELSLLKNFSDGRSIMNKNDCSNSVQVCLFKSFEFLKFLTNHFIP